MSAALVPDAEVAGLLAGFRDAAAHHEAGHVVLADLYHEPVEEVAVWYVRTRRWVGPDEWSVTGRTLTSPADPAVGLLVAVAGVEAEALRTGRPARRLRAANPGDLRLVADYGRRTDLSEDDARHEARALLHDHWGAVEAVADALSHTGRLTGRDLARIL
ncbi:hypothetical protein [Actinosynnema sp. NPDC023587]|uniref:hypothetical protein n=1 Tax=Actinosynnema sp. NPDC023587 TaxID=3154695 RepID=UPI0033C9B6B5